MSELQVKLTVLSALEERVFVRIGVTGADFISPNSQFAWGILLTPVPKAPRAA